MSDPRIEAYERSKELPHKLQALLTASYRYQRDPTKENRKLHRAAFWDFWQTHVKYKKAVRIARENKYFLGGEDYR